VQIGYVADVDHAEGEARAAGDCAVHESFNDFDGGREIGAQYGAEDAYRVDYREF
jgi:hypothetical protein